MAELSMLADR